MINLAGICELLHTQERISNPATRLPGSDPGGALVSVECLWCTVNAPTRRHLRRAANSKVGASRKSDRFSRDLPPMGNLTIVAGRAPCLLHGAMQVARGRIIFAKGDAWHRAHGCAGGLGQDHRDAELEHLPGVGVGHQAMPSDHVECTAEGHREHRGEIRTRSNMDATRQTLLHRGERIQGWYAK